jgi:DNA-binding response OmpR family regulator
MILFIEDETSARHAFAELLRAEGYQVLEAEDGAENGTSNLVITMRKKGPF